MNEYKSDVVVETDSLANSGMCHESGKPIALDYIIIMKMYIVQK